MFTNFIFIIIIVCMVVKESSLMQRPCYVIKLKQVALAGVAQWIECQPVNQRVTGSIPGQGTCLGYGPGSQWGVHERQPHIDVSLPLFLPPSSSLKINK